MIRIHPVQVALFLSVISLFGFIVFGTAVNHVSDNYEQKSVEVREEEDRAAARLSVANQRIVELQNRADSLHVIAEAERRNEVLWVARAIYSETKRPHEMWYVGWVIRNRYEARYRGDTYREVILHPKQFSAFNRGMPLRDYYMRLEPKHVGEAPRWHDALKVAQEVVDAPGSWRPIPKDTYHFFSEVSMDGGRHPGWSYSLTKVSAAPIEESRFRFYRNAESTTTTTASAR